MPTPPTLRLIPRQPNHSYVVKWQQILADAGYLSNDEIDGIFGPVTHKATVEYQSDKGLAPDGIVGPRTWATGRGASLPPLPPFSPLTSTTQRQSLFGAFTYTPAPTPGNPEAISIEQRWARENLVFIKVPQLVGVEGAPHDGGVWFHRKGVKPLQRLWAEWEKEGLLPLVKTWGGSFVPRFIRGSRRTLSNHAFGTAFDINMAWNGLGAVPAPAGAEGSVQELVPIAHKHGFYWGGHFKRADGMHFELAVVQ
jgi:hypothetical protein